MKGEQFGHDLNVCIHEMDSCTGNSVLLKLLNVILQNETLRYWTCKTGN